MPRTQVNVRLDPDLLARIEARRQPLGINRNEWICRALEFALAQPPRQTAITRKANL